MLNTPRVTSSASDLQAGGSAELLARLGTSERGLTTAQAAQRLAQVGPNEPPFARRASGDLRQ
jgi:hypothetical protein